MPIGAKEANLELEEKISQINEMQRQLVMQEKMASLGGLTAVSPMRLKSSYFIIIFPSFLLSLSRSFGRALRLD